MSPGIAIGPPLLFDPRHLGLPPRHIGPGDVSSELQRLEQGLQSAHDAAALDQADARSRLGPEYADILAAHAQMILDSKLRREASLLVERDNLSAEHAVAEVLDHHASLLENLTDPFLASRAADVRDIQRRILEHLMGTRLPTVSEASTATTTPSIVLAHDLSPSQASRLDPSQTPGFATEAGGRASHTAIVAAALEIPAVVGLGPFLDRVRTSSLVIIDGDKGLVFVDPDAATLERYRADQTQRQARFDGLSELIDMPCQTRDGTLIELYGNIEFPAEVEACRRRGASGVGLYRTEFLYLAADQPPTEEEQFNVYRTVVQEMGGLPVTFRTLDLGADRLVSYLPIATPTMRNPSLGLRSIRLSLRDPDLFRTQIRAILRASAYGPARILFPLISTLPELRQARVYLEQVIEELRSSGIELPARTPVGAMIEVPAAALMAHQLAKEVDFLAIGTNDLTQYTLAVDRTDETVANLYNAADPAVLKLIAMGIDAARSSQIEISICGSMGGDPLYAMILLGMGLRQLSMPPHQILEVKRVIRTFDLAQAESVAAHALELESGEAVETFLRQQLQKLIPEHPSASQSSGSVPKLGS